MILRFGQGFWCTFCQTCRNLCFFCAYLCFYWNSFSGDNVEYSQTTSSSNRLGRTRVLWSYSEPTVWNIWNWRHHFTLRDDEQGLTEPLSALPFVHWLKLRLDFEGRLSIRLCQHITGRTNLISNSCTVLPCPIHYQATVPLLQPWPGFGGRNSVQVVSRWGFSTQQCGAASSKIVW